MRLNWYILGSAAVICVILLLSSCGERYIGYNSEKDLYKTLGVIDGK